MTRELLVSCLLAAVARPAAAGEPSVSIRQITTGPEHHFFGYIGHVRTIPWNESGRYIVALRAGFQDHMPGPEEHADVVLLDTRAEYAVRKVDETRGWNPQQGTMLYWNPRAPETQFFFNDRDRQTGKLFTVLFDVERRSRVREYRFEDNPVANSGVSAEAGAFLAINYGRMARLRPVTGYKQAFDWTAGVAHPEDDGVFRVDIETGQKTLIVPFRRLRAELLASRPDVESTSLFINHTLWNREGDRVFFFARANWQRRRPPGVKRIDQPFVVNPDGSNLVMLKDHFGGHPEWASGPLMIGAFGGRQIVYDTDGQQVVKALGTPEIFPRPGGDIALSPDGSWLVNGYRQGGENRYVLFRLPDGAYVRTRGFDQHGWTKGDLRNDPAPCWNRDGTQILFPSIADDVQKTRQLFLLDLDVTPMPE